MSEILLRNELRELRRRLESMKAERDAQQKRADALAVENAALNEMNCSLCAELREYESDYCQFGPMPQSVVNCFALHTPATSAALAAIQAQGVEKAIERLMNMFASTGHIGIPVMALEGLAKELREAK